MIYCEVKDREVLDFYGKLLNKVFYNQAFLNPKHVYDFEKVLLFLLEKYPRVNRNLGNFYVKRFLEVFDIEKHSYTSPNDVSKLTGRFIGDYNGALGRIVGTLLYKGHFNLYKQFLMFNEYDRDYIRKRQIELKPYVLHKDNFKCVKCGSNENLHTHHIRPVSKGGKSTLDNLITLCEDCHREIHKTKNKQYLAV